MIQSRWKFYFLSFIMVLGFAFVLLRLARLQITPDDDYASQAQETMTKTIYETGSRGQIRDVNGALLAFDKKIYNIMFYRAPGSKREVNGTYSKAIWEVISLLQSKGKEITLPFWLSQNEDGLWEFSTGTEDPGVAQKREDMFRVNFSLRNTDVQDIYGILSDHYMIDDIDKEFPEDQKLTQEDKIKVLSVLQEMQMNAFLSVPILLARDVDWTTVMEIETRLSQLPGISISVENQRVYPKGTLACHILGYTGLMQKQSQIDEYVGVKKYLRTDRIGLDGVEMSMEAFLTPNAYDRRGYTLAEIDRSGRQIRTLAKVEPKDGNTIKLTIDSALQKVVEDELAAIVNGIRNIQEKKIQEGAWQEAKKEELLKYEAAGRQLKLAQNGAIVVMDMNARVLAMASHPNYDPNLFILGMDDDQYERMFDDRNPLLNNAILAADEPGSVFKMCTALAALYYDEVTITEEITDGGKFTKYDPVFGPRCWISEGARGSHANLNIEGGISKSCNYFFYTLASRLWRDMDGDGLRLYEFATKMGLTSKTNIDLPGEKKSLVGSQLTLYDPSRPITGYDQDTWLPVQVRNRLKEHLRAVGESRGLTYSDERLNICAKSLMDMAVSTNQGDEMIEWMQRIREILMDELSMPRDLVFRASTMSDLVRYLNDIKWGGSQTIMAAVGQSVTMITPVGMARYIAAIANGGYVYDVQLIDSIISPTGEVIRSFNEPVLINDLSADIGEFLPTIWAGMAGVVDEGGTAQDAFRNFKYDINIVAGKTGTAQKSKLDIENNSWFVSFAPADAPEIVVVVYVPNGYSGALSAPAAANILQYYIDSKVVDQPVIHPAPNGLAQ